MFELGLVSTEELIKEIVGRSTFAGLILFSPEEHRFNDQVHEEFHLLTTATADGTEDLLLRALETVRNAI